MYTFALFFETLRTISVVLPNQYPKPVNPKPANLLYHHIL